MSVRRICFALGISRSLITYKPKPPRYDDRPLVDALAKLKTQHPTFGYRKMTALLQQQGFEVSFTRVLRLWREHGWLCKRPTRQRKKAKGSDQNACHIRKPSKTNQVWAIDFVSDRTSDGKPLKILTVLDEFTREGIGVIVSRTMGQKDVAKTLKDLMKGRGKPQYIRSDNGGEFAGNLIQKALNEIGCEVACQGPKVWTT